MTKETSCIYTEFTFGSSRFSGEAFSLTGEVFSLAAARGVLTASFAGLAASAGAGAGGDAGAGSGAGAGAVAIVTVADVCSAGCVGCGESQVLKKYSLNNYQNSKILGRNA